MMPRYFFLRIVAILSASLSSITADTSICHSHIYHSSPRSIVNSILTDVSASKSDCASDDRDTIQIDVSSSRLDDAAISLLVDRLLLRDEEKSDNYGGDRKIKLDLSMNQLTPDGAANLFNRLLIQANHTVANDEIEIKRNDSHVESLASNVTLEDGIAHATELEEDEIKETQEPQQPNQDTELEELDLSFNDIGGHGSHIANLELLTSTRRLFECHGNGNNKFLVIPRVFSMENCGIGPAFCRSIGRGILNAFEWKQTYESPYRPSVLRLGGNEAIEDSGAVSLAAALRLAVSSPENDDKDDKQHVLEELDLSSCSIGDAGAESLALALAYNPNCILKLDLSNNVITDVGARAIGRALVEVHRHNIMKGCSSHVLDKIVLDNNVKIGDEGAEKLAEAMACGAVRCISLRSCSVKAGGAAAFGKSIVSLANQKGKGGLTRYEIDLSGNAMGIKSVKRKKGLKDKASSHISSLGKTLQKGWRGGLKGASVSMGLTAESDDDEEGLSVMGGLIDDEDEDNEQSTLTALRCGARSFAAAIIEDAHPESNIDESERLNAIIAFRRCNLDDGAFDALSASITELNKKSCAKIAIDVSMNTVEHEAIHALMRDEKEVALLNSMSQRHMAALSVLNEMRERAALAADVARARANIESQFGGMSFEDDGDKYYDDQYGDDQYDDDQYDDY